MEQDKLLQVRKKIDALDAELLRVLAERFSHVREIRAIKKEIGLTPLDSKRWEEVLVTRLREAEKLGLSPEFTRKILECIHEESLMIEG